MSSSEIPVTETPSTPLEKAWAEAFDRMSEAAPHEEQDTIALITAEFDDPDLIAEFRDKHKTHLTPESVFFLDMSEAVKRSRTEQDS